ncbi:MAG: NAD-glutamate dehydrogenase domain-containing protein, partial [Rhodospirillales bacterium]
MFISGLLDLTDNIERDKIIPPKNVVRRDGDDPYLVVAADKGTATFSDIANELAVSYNYWLGDAFASGGSCGYDHKAMGITAKGAWESVKRHFREIGIDVMAEEFTCIGVGDMSGDVFGNGLIYSPYTKLLAAFNHQHIFIDPNPNPKVSFEERLRLFESGCSGWSDYDPNLISAGGGVFGRDLKSISVSPEMRTLFALGKVKSVTPDELITHILRAKVNLLWFGGIGTYVKSSTESNLEVGDRSNDALRIDAKQLGADVVGEGANLGITQLGRVEFAVAGGKINTDFIDNSAGVDCSDHEVNIKILLDAAV